MRKQGHCKSKTLMTNIGLSTKRTREEEGQKQRDGGVEEGQKQRDGGVEEGQKQRDGGVEEGQKQRDGGVEEGQKQRDGGVWKKDRSREMEVWKKDRSREMEVWKKDRSREMEVWRKAQDIGLRQGYLEDNSTYTYVRKLMALLLFPTEHVTPIFRVLEAKAKTPQLQLLGTVLSQYVVAVGFLIEKKLLLDMLPIMVTIVILIQ